MTLLDATGEIRSEYIRISQEGGSGAVRQIEEHMAAYLPQLSENIMILGNDPELQTVISAEDGLLGQLRQVVGFWQWLRANNHVMLDSEEPQQAKTTIPPLPGDEVTGQAVLAYLKELQAWVAEVSQELWAGDRPFELAEIGDRYLIGEFSQAYVITQTLRDGVTLRETWIQVADCGAYWGSVSIGSFRAKLIFKACEIIERLLNPVVFGDGWLKT